MAVPRRDFLNEPAPENYVAGLGRGATGFTTRSDIGPAREGPSEDAIKEELAKRAEQLQNGIQNGENEAQENADDNEDEERFRDNENDEGLFASGAYDEDDREADRIYQEVDDRMDSRRRARREERESREQEEFESKNPKISNQFADLKRALSAVSDDEWASLPGVGDLTGKNRRSRKQIQSQRRFYAVPDSILASGSQIGAYENTAPADEDGSASSIAGTITDFRQISFAKDKMLLMRLDQAGTDSVMGTTNIDPKGYLTSLSSSVVKTSNKVSDTGNNRELLLSLVKSNPKNANGWIALAKLEEQDNRLTAARKYIQQGCENCPTNEDVWLENIKLNPPDYGKVIAANAVQHIPRSVTIWQQAMKLETETMAKKKIVRKALENIPQSVTLWKEAVGLESDPRDARILLARATSLIPLAVELWISLARLETEENARKVLNKARQAVRTSPEIWIEAARLEEKAGNVSRVEMVISRGISELQRRGGMLTRDQWIEEAEKCEIEDKPITCQAIIHATLGQGLEQESSEPIWIEDAQSALSKNCFATARAIFAYALRVFPSSITLWNQAIVLEKSHGSAQNLFAILEKSVEACPSAKDLWLLYAKECLAVSDLDGARSVLSRAFENNPDDQDIWLTAVDIEAENNEHDKARMLLAQAREGAGTERIWIKSVVLERQLKDSTRALDLVNGGLQKYPRSSKLWILKAQIYESDKLPEQAREVYVLGTKACPHNVTLWILYSRLEEADLTRSRSVLERAALANRKNERLWLERIRVEKRAANLPQARTLVASALQECPVSGAIWAESVSMESRTQRKPRLIDALKKCDNDPIVIAAIAKLFYAERKREKAKSWLEKAIKADSDNGDHWALLYKLLDTTGASQAEKDTFYKQFFDADPRHGEQWPQIAKDVNNFGKTKIELLELTAQAISF
ncbi:PRP1 splicing factor, N-terminal-domain-containing protein [Lipomyces oligophaga]|uniref:PRP1 splicing factor, N-terminal-domain-containing protein n=1 Tax=Lipomyces oligophaga TaxID=45792 RepID=UPI0034CF4E10